MVRSKTLRDPASKRSFHPSTDICVLLKSNTFPAPVELLNSGRHRVVLLTVQVGSGLAEQRHLYANKRVTVLEGCAGVHHDERSWLIHEGDTHFVPFGTKHRIYNAGKIELKVLELRSGACVEDDDLAS